MGHPPSNQTQNGFPVNRRTVREAAIGFKGSPSPYWPMLGRCTAAATRSASLASCLNDTGYCANCTASPLRRAPASRKVNTYCTPATGTFTTISGDVAIQSWNFWRQYNIAANVCSTLELSFRNFVVLTHPTGTNFDLADASSARSCWYSTPPYPPSV